MVKGQKDGPKVNLKRNWQIMVHKQFTLRISCFFQTKSGMVKPTLEQFGKWRQAGIVVKYWRCNNTGKNRLLKQRTQSSDWQFAITFEYTTQDTPQQNHLAELGFAVLAARGRTLMHQANVLKAMRYQVFPKAFETA
eukprot:15346424-Ditylum_brightwellii.AAC.1